ncbi:MAG: DNA-binding transcriptional regulator CytR [Termitinemataceae bacterium]|nr:MAG: DNA-binding transcriptional regulator CytR [Termitinemataceae bacterium]
MENITNGKKSTYQQIAKETGLSPATISRVFTGAQVVKEETRQKVLSVLKEFGYDISKLPPPDGNNSRLLILNVPNIDNPFYTVVLHGAKTAAMQRGYQLLTNEEHINENTIANFLTMLLAVNAAGLILTNHVPTHLLKKLSDVIPFVQCCEYDESLDIPYVSIDNVAAAKTATDYIISLGRKSIAFINGPLRYKYARDRLSGFKESLKNAGIPFDPDLVIQLPDINYDLAVSALSTMLDSGAKPNAFFCASDVLASAVIKVLLRRGINVPNEIAVVGVDNINISIMTTPTITTISQPGYQLGFTSCGVLIERIHNPKTQFHNIVLPTELIVRESTMFNAHTESKT